MLAIVGRSFTWTISVCHRAGPDILEVPGRKQCANSITDIFISNGVAHANWHTEQCRTDGDSLQTFEMNILHYETFCTVYGSAAKQQRRYEQLFHRHRCYAFFLTVLTSLPLTD